MRQTLFELAIEGIRNKKPTKFFSLVGEAVLELWKGVFDNRGYKHKKPYSWHCKSHHLWTHNWMWFCKQLSTYIVSNSVTKIGCYHQRGTVEVGVGHILFQVGGGNIHRSREWWSLAVLRRWQSQSSWSAPKSWASGQSTHSQISTWKNSLDSINASRPPAPEEHMRSTCVEKKAHFHERRHPHFPNEICQMQGDAHTTTAPCATAWVCWSLENVWISIKHSQSLQKLETKSP